MAFTPALAKASSVVTATCPAPKATERASASLEAEDVSWDRVNVTYPLVNIQKAIENGHRNSEFSHE